MAVTKKFWLSPWKSAMHCFGMVPKSTASRTRSCIFLRHTKLKNYDVYVLSNGIFEVQTRIVEDACSMIRHIPLGTTHLGRIAALNQLSREICSHECSLIDAWNRLERCKNISFGKTCRPHLLCGLGCGCFSYLFGGTALDSIVGFFIGMLLQGISVCLKAP